MSVAPAVSPSAPTHAGDEAVEQVISFDSMGGTVTLRAALPREAESTVHGDLVLVSRRIERWAARITRFDPDSELGRLNRASSDRPSEVGPTLGRLLRRAQDMAALTGGFVDVSLLDARLAAEGGAPAEQGVRRWWLERLGRGSRVHRQGAVAFDLDGVGKGWIADRALALLDRYPAAMVDADGDIAMRPGECADWAVAIADPRDPTSDLAILSPPVLEAGTFGIATSGTTVHRWEHPGGWAHHLIDPRTGAPADTDVVQATVIAGDALTAESLAKAVVIAGSEDGLRSLARAGAHAAFILLRSGELIAPAGSEAWLA